MRIDTAVRRKNGPCEREALDKENRTKCMPREAKGESWSQNGSLQKDESDLKE
jgi:hypothetical protein